MERPSIRELYIKTRQAKEAIKNGNVMVVEPDVIAADAIDLGYQSDDLKNVLLSILHEIDVRKNYAGTRPPQKSYKPKIEGCELFAFSWKSKYFGCKAYLKFAFKQDVFWLSSLHEDRK